MEAGQRIRDYILEEKIGAGGAGEVWRARHQYLDHTVAIKAVYRHASQGSDFHERFLKEASVMASLEHPHIVSLHEFFFLDDIPYLVMTYIASGSLADLLKRHGRLPRDRALHLSRGILEALNFAHSQGVIHRDVKPSNILVRPDGHAYLVDFGIALVVGKQRHTRFGTNIGTPEYMSPEQIQAQELDHRTDVYSFGCVLYEMLAGQPPFSYQDAGQSEYEIMSGHLHGQPRSLRELNPEVDEHIESVVFRALAKAPDQRYGGCQELREALDDAKPHPNPLPYLGNNGKKPHGLYQFFKNICLTRKTIYSALVLLCTVLVVISLNYVFTKKGSQLGDSTVAEPQTPREPQTPQEPQTPRRPTPISAESTLPLRVLARPLSNIYKAKDAQEVVQENVPTFQAYYVYARPENRQGKTDAQGWYQVGSNDRGEILGWMRAEDVIEWKQTMSLTYTHPAGRHSVLMFAHHDGLRELMTLPAQQRHARVQQLYATIESGKALPNNFPVVSVEPKKMIDINKEFYLLPIIDFESLKQMDGKREGRLVKLAAATAFGSDVRDTSDIRNNTGYLGKAIAPGTTVDLSTLQALQADIVFVIDTSISMQPYINGVRDTVRDGVRSMAQQASANASLRFGLWGYRDSPQETPGIEYNTKNYTPTLQPIEEFERTLAEVKEASASDRDYPEDVFSGVHKALTETKWRQGGLRFLLLIGDAPGHELGQRKNLSGHDENTLRSFASDQKIYIMSFSLKNPRYSNYHALAARHFRRLADNPGAQKGPTYHESVSTGAGDAFKRDLQSVFAELVKIVADAKRGQVHKDEYADNSPQGRAADMGHAALVQWIGSQTGTRAPRDITAWALDKDLLDFDIQAMDVRVLLNKRQVDSLKIVLSEVIAAGRRGQISGEDFFTALQAVSATVVRQPDQIKNARALVNTGLIPDFLKGLPYTSPLMAMTNELWKAWSPDDQDQFLRTLEAKNKYYVTVHDTQEGWIRLNRQDDPDEAVFPVRLESLP